MSDASNPPLPERKAPTGHAHAWIWIPSMALALALSPLAFVHPLRVDGRSMMPALQDGSIRLALRDWCSGGPRRGQVWLVDGPDGPAIKRVIGLPGERLEQREGEVWIQERRLDEAYVERPERGDGGPWGDGQGYLVMGDNRPESRDGRAWGPLPRSAFRSRLLGM